MVALKGPQVEAYLNKPNPAQPIALVFGPDAGLVRERVELLVRTVVKDPNDPFSLARLEGDELAAEPSRLVEEANTIPLFGGRRAVWVKAGSRNVAPAVEALAATASPDCCVIIEAGDLKRNAPLRAVCERAKNIAVLPCYADGDKELGRLIDTEMKAAGLAISSDARAMLLPLLGGDRLASRSEISKLTLYALGKGRVEVDDVIAAVADASTLALDNLVDAAFAGKTADVENQFGKARNAGTSAGTIVFAASRQAALLHKIRLTIEQGQSVANAVSGLYVNFRRAALIEASLRDWTSEHLADVMIKLSDATFETRRRPDLAEAVAQRALLAIAQQAKRRPPTRPFKAN